MSSTQTHYFFGENADRPIRVGKHTFSFEITQRIGGTAQGVISVGASDYEAFKAVAQKYGVKEISEADYHDAKKKPGRFSPRPTASLVNSRAGTEAAAKTDGDEPAAPPPTAKRVTLPPVKGDGAIVVPGGQIERSADKTALPTAVGDAVVVAKAAPPVETAAAAAKPRKARAPRAELLKDLPDAEA